VWELGWAKDTGGYEKGEAQVSAEEDTTGDKKKKRKKVIVISKGKAGKWAQTSECQQAQLGAIGKKPEPERDTPNEPG